MRSSWADSCTVDTRRRRNSCRDVREANSDTKAERRRCLSEVGTQADDFLQVTAGAARTAETVVATKLLMPAAAIAAADHRRSQQTLPRKPPRLAVQGKAVATDAHATGLSQERRLQQLRLELLQGTAKRLKQSSSGTKEGKLRQSGRG